MKNLKKSVFILLSILSLAIFSCDSWMKDDDFFSDIENQVKVANAPKINVYVRYAMNRQGKTEPDGYDIFKVGIPHDISASTEPEYGFVRWAAFSTEDKNGEKLFLGTGDNQSQNKDIYFIDDEDYKERILPHELSEEVVTFEDAKNPNTVVTINEERNDIYLMPIIAQRPTLSLTIPANGGKDVVRNMAVRISFTKPMDPESFKNESGEYDKITITQGGTTFTATGDMELNSDDITDHFIIDSSMFSLNKKMITLKFNDAALSEGYASRSTVTVSISKEVKDSYGFSMAEDNGISFTVGNKKDSLAPRITSLTAGSGTAFNDFQGVYKNTGTIDSLGQMTRITHEGANLAPSADITNNFYDSYILNRIGQDSKLILRIYAEDIAGAGSGQNQDGFEADVTQVLIRAKHLYNADGTEDTEAKMTDPTYYGYVAQQNNTSLSGTYRELVNNANKPLIEAEQDVLDSSYGGLFEYDLSGFPDGLIQVDVSAADVVGNIGFFSSDDEISTEYGNGYASLFIVKDTTSPSAEANKNYVQADLTIVPNGRGFFNAEYYKRLAVVQSGGTIEDSGHERLRAPNAELKWIIVPGSDTNWASTVKADDARWKPVTQSYAPAQSALPTKDGSVDFTYAVMDNLGNISDAVVFKSITYDNTIPSLSPLGMTGINGYVSSSVNDVVLENQILSIPVTDSTAGLEAIEVGITCIKDGVTSEEYASPFASSKLAVKVNGNSTTYKINGKKLTFTNPIVGQSTVTIQGLQIADSNNLVDNSIYRIAIKVTDAAVNTSVQQTKDIKNDTTAPVINSITVNNINSGAAVGGGLEYWTRESTSQTALYINLTETNTGAKVFDFSGSTIKLRSDTSLIWNNTAIPVSVDTSANKLTITDESNTIITAATGGQVIIKNVDLTAAENGNRVSLTITDLVTNKSSAVSRFTLENGSVIDSFRYDAASPVVNSVILENHSDGEGGPAEPGFTNNEYIDAILNLTSTASGIYQITVSGASFDTRILVDGKSASNEEAGFSISGNNTIILKTNSGANNRLLKNSAELNHFELTNVKLPSGDGDKNVSFTVTNLAARTSSAATTSIRLDKTAPVWVGDGVFVAASNTNTASIYPHTSTASSGNVKINGTVYFYTKDTINISASVTETNRKNANEDLYIDGSGPVAEFASVAPDTDSHTIYIVDKAGNKSAEKTFYVVQDTSAPAAFGSYVTLPTDNVYRGNTADADGTANYIVKKADTSKLLVKLTGLTSSDKNVDGTACSALERYAELNAQTTSSPIEYYAFSTDGSKNWQAIGNGQITIPLTASSTPYTLYLKDGCGNEASYKIPVNWTVDGTITDIPETSKDISPSSLKANAAKNISYYKGDTTPLVNLTGFNDSCYYPNIEASTSSESETATDDFTLKSRLFVWTNLTTEPTETTYTTSPSFTPWVYLTLKSSSDAATMVMAHHYPKYNVTSAYKLYYVVEDRVGNVLIKQLKNTSDNTELWMYDNTAPTIVPQTAAKVNKIGEVNYYSSNSTISLNITDSQSGIGKVRTTEYTGNDVKNSLEAIKYQLDQISPSQDLSISIDGIVDYAGNAMANTQITVPGAGGTWHKQSHPSLAATPVSVIDCTGSSSGTGGTSYGQGNYSASIDDDSSTSGKRIKVQAPRSVTGIKFALDVTCDSEELLGWRITSSALSSADIASDKFYDQSLLGSTLTYIARSTDGKYEYSYSKTDTSAKWENITNKVQYFYAVNKAGLICPTPIIIEFASNPVPQVSNRTLNVNYNSSANKNFMNSSSTIKFVSDITITRCEFYKGNSETPALTVPDGSYTLSDSNKGFELNATNLLSSFDEAEELTVKLYTATEESEKYELTKSGYASSNQFVYDAVAPVIKSIQVKEIRKGTENRNAESPSYTYYATDSSSLVDLYVTLVEENTGVYQFDFAWSRTSFNLTDNTELYKVLSDGTEERVANGRRDGKYYYIDSYDDSLRDSSGADVTVKFTNVQLSTSSLNQVRLRMYDNTKAYDECLEFTLDDGTKLSGDAGFYYDNTNPTLAAFTLSDRAKTYYINGSDKYEIPCVSGFTNEREVNTTLYVTPGSSGLAQLKATNAEFVSGTTKIVITSNETEEADRTNVVEGTGGSIDSENGTITTVPFTVAAAADGSSILTFSNNQVFKGALKVEIYNLRLSSGDGLKNVTIEALSLANKKNTTTCSDTITLDMTPPVWVDDGIYAPYSDNSTRIAEIYPHPVANEYDYGLKKGSNVYFYKGGSYLKLRAHVTETNLPTAHLRYTDSSTNNEVIDPSIGTYSFYVFDEAGNKTADIKTVTILKDTSGPASVQPYITFVEPMKDGVAAGKVFRGVSDSTQYVIKKIEDSNVDPYKIKIKLGGVTTSDIKLNGTAATATTAYTELYETASGTANSTFAAASNAPIEYFAVTEGTSTAPIASSSCWIRILDSTTHYAGDDNKLKVTGGSTITIDLPKDQNCGAIYLHLKDGCGNTSFTRISTASTSELAWVVDGEIGQGSYSVDFKGDNNSSANNSYVIMNTPYDADDSDSGDIAINNGVTYYREGVSGSSASVPVLKLSYKDACTLPSTYTGTEYSLRARLAAGNWTTTPTYADLASSELSTSKKWHSDWATIKVSDSNSSGAGETSITFPGSNASAITGTSATDPYQLWYLIEDAVGNYNIVQLKNRASATSTDVTKWMFDATGPVITVTDSDFAKVNTIAADSKNYYSVNSTVTAAISDAGAGVYGETNRTYVLDNYSSLDELSYTSTSKKFEITGIKDILGNASSLELKKNGKDTWTKLSVTDISSKAETVNFANEYNNGYGITGTVEADHGATTTNPASYYYQIKVKGYYRQLKVTMPSYTDILGWIAVDGDKWSTVDTSDTAFYSVEDLTIENAGTYDKNDFIKNDSVYDYSSAWTPRTKYFYAVNKAGLISSKPIEIAIVENPIPTISTMTFDNVTKYSNEPTNYINSNSSVTITTTYSPTKYHIVSIAGDAETTIVEEKSIPSNNTIPLNLDSLNEGKTLYLIVSTATEDSAKYPLNGQSGSNSWLYDATAPSFSLTSVENASQLQASSTSEQIIDQTYWVTNSENAAATLTFSASDDASGIASYEMSEDNGSTWTEITLSDMKYGLASENIKKNYKFRVKDKAGNVSTILTFALQKDVDAPNASVAPTFTKADSSDVVENTDYILSADSGTGINTIYYKNSGSDKVENATITISNVTDAGVGVDSVYYTLDGGSEIQLNASSDKKYTISVALSEGDEKAYKIYAKDYLGNSQVLKAYTFNGKNPSGDISYSKVDNTTDFDNSTSTIYYRAGLDKLVFTTADLKNAAGGKVSLYLDDNAQAFITNADITGSFELSLTPPLSGNHKIVAKDSLGNKKEFTYSFNYSKPSGNLIPADVSDSVVYDSSNATVYYNSGLTALNFTSSNLKDARGNAVALYLDDATEPFVVAAAISGNVELPISAGFTGTHKITAKDSIGNTNEYSYTFKCDSPVGSVDSLAIGTVDENGSWTGAASPASDSESGDYILTSDAESNTDSIIYNPSKVNKIKFNSGAITDSGLGNSYYIVKLGETEESTHYAAESEIAISLDASWTTELTCQIIARDAVGNSSLVKTVKLKAHATAPVVEKENTPAYSGLATAPSYGNVDYILGFDTDANFIISQEANEVKEEEIYIWTWNNKTRSTEKKKTNQYIIRKLIEGTTFTLPVKVSSLPSNALYYQITYNTLTLGEDWVKVDDVSGGKLENVAIDLTNDNFTRHTFIFVWYKDELGNISVHNLTYPKATGQNWFTVDGKDTLEENCADAPDDGKKYPNIALIEPSSGDLRSAGSNANIFTRFVNNVFGRNESTATPVKTVQVFENHTLDTVDTVSEVVSKTNKASSKAKSKKSSAKKAAVKKESTNKAALVEKTVEKLAEQEPLVQSAIEVLETVEDTVKESVEVTKEETVTAKATVKAAPKASAVEPLEPSVQVQLEPAADSAEFDTFDIKLIFTLLAIIVAASGLLLAFVIKKVKNNG